MRPPRRPACAAECIYIKQRDKVNFQRNTAADRTEIRRILDLPAREREGFDEKARWIVTCNFDEFRIYDRTKPLAPPLTLTLGNLPKEAHRLAFLVNPKEKAVDREREISVQAGRIVGEIDDALLGQYCVATAPSPSETAHDGEGAPRIESTAALASRGYVATHEHLAR